MANYSLKYRRMLARGFGRQNLRSQGGHVFTGIGNRATLTTAIAGANNDITFLARKAGTAGNAIRFGITVAGNNTALSVAVSGSDITVTSATNGAGSPTSTAVDVIRAVRYYPAASALVWPQRAPANDGTGVVAALALTALSGAV